MQTEDTTRVDIIVHPEFHTKHYGYTGLEVLDYEKAMIDVAHQSKGKVIWLEEPQVDNSGLFARCLDGIDYSKLSTAWGEGLLRQIGDATAFWEIIEGIENFRISGTYLHQCVAQVISSLTAALVTNNPAHLIYLDPRDFGDLTRTPFDIKVGTALEDTRRKGWYKPLSTGSNLYDEATKIYKTTDEASPAEPF